MSEENQGNSTDTATAPVPEQPAIQHLLVALGGKEYGVRMSQLQEVLRYNPDAVAPVPNTVEWLEGIMSLRGTIISVASLRLFLGMPRFDPDEMSSRFGYDLGIGFGRPVPRLLVAYKAEVVIGMVVDDIKGVLFVQPGGVKELAPDEGDEYGQIRHYIAGIYTEPETKQATPLLDVPLLIQDMEKLQLEPVKAG